MTDKQELIIFTKTYDFALWLMKHTEKFPKSARFSVSARIENKILEFLECIVTANRLKNKYERLNSADNVLENLRILIRLSKDMQFVNLRSYEYAVRQMDEIGRLLGGWLKQQKAIESDLKN